MNRLIKDDGGFTLIEALVAIVILVIGVLATYTMQSTSIKGNANAIALTGAANWATNQIEHLLALDYDHGDLDDDNGDGSTGLDEVAAADGNAQSPDGRYTIYWNVAEDILTSLPNPTVKAIRVIVVHNMFGKQKQVAMVYYKQKIY